MLHSVFSVALVAVVLPRIPNMGSIALLYVGRHLSAVCQQQTPVSSESAADTCQQCVSSRHLPAVCQHTPPVSSVSAHTTCQQCVSAHHLSAKCQKNSRPTSLSTSWYILVAAQLPYNCTPLCICGRCRVLGSGLK